MRHSSIEQALIYALQEIKERSYDYVRIRGYFNVSMQTAPNVLKYTHESFP